MSVSEISLPVRSRYVCQHVCQGKGMVLLMHDIYMHREIALSVCLIAGAFCVSDKGMSLSGVDISVSMTVRGRGE